MLQEMPQGSHRKEAQTDEQQLGAGARFSSKARLLVLLLVVLFSTARRYAFRTQERDAPRGRLNPELQCIHLRMTAKTLPV